jgi:tetratricopeptide (TPR) repeat protein
MLFVILCIWLSQAAPAAQQPPELLLLSRWVRSVERHEPARADVEAATIAVWSRDDLRATVETLQSLRDALQRAARADGADKDPQDIRTQSGHRLSGLQAQALLGLTDDEAQRGDVNRLLKRGAMLHSDIAMLAQEGVIRAAEPTVPGAPRGGGPIQVVDGTARGPDEADRHWATARAFLEIVVPDPARDEWVHRWYRAAAARMRRDSLLASSEPLLARARQLFPKDAVFPFYGGCLHATYASPAIQAVYASAASPSSQRNRVAPWQSGPHSSQAAERFREALALQPAWPEARVRLGRVLGLLGRHKEAAATLRRALDETDDLPLVYWGCLFLGVEEEALGRDADARTAYERARKLRPGAQAPSLSLSQLARRAGDRLRAIAELRAVLALPADAVSRYDLLWDYHGARTSEADILFAELRRQLGTGGTPDAGAAR